MWQSVGIRGTTLEEDKRMDLRKKTNAALGNMLDKIVTELISRGNRLDNLREEVDIWNHRLFSLELRLKNVRRKNVNEQN